MGGCKDQSLLDGRRHLRSFSMEGAFPSSTCASSGTVELRVLSPCPPVLPHLPPQEQRASTPFFLCRSLALGREEHASHTHRAHPPVLCKQRGRVSAARPLLRRQFPGTFGDSLLSSPPLPGGLHFSWSHTVLQALTASSSAEGTSPSPFSRLVTARVSGGQREVLAPEPAPTRLLLLLLLF